MEQWAPFFYVYGIGGLVFGTGLFIAWRKGALTSRRLAVLLFGGLLGYALLHGLLQSQGSAGAYPTAGEARGTTGFVGSWIDIAVILVYFAVVVGVGSYFARFTRTSTDFFFGGRRFKGWLVALSCVATTIGSYSFLKYSSVGFQFGLASTMTYLNDWFWMPLWMLVWLPIIYYGRIKSIPEYFERRFGRDARTIATMILLIYLLGYIGINFFTLGKAVHALTGWPIFLSACGAAAATAVYVAVGGQTSVIMTDLAQSVLLLLVGIGLFIAGIHHLGGWEAFWTGLPETHKMGLAPLQEPAAFHTMGVFWQDAMAGGIAFYFINQGIMMRFMSAKNVAEGRKAVAIVVLIIMPLAAVSVSGVGWVGSVMSGTGELTSTIAPDNVFVVVSEILAMPGVFGLIMAALVAALMSTVDTLVTAVSAVIVNDVWEPYFGEGKEDSNQDLKIARMATLGASATGLALVPLFMQFKTIFAAHAAFVAAVIPPMAVTLVLGITWSRFGSRSAVITLLGGVGAVAASLAFPEIIAPFDQGAATAGEGLKAHKFMRAFYGLAVSGVLAVICGFFVREEEVDHPLLVAGPEANAKAAFKGGKPKEQGAEIRLGLEVTDDEKVAIAEHRDELDVHLHPDDRERLGAEAGDLVVVSAPGGWHGGLKSVHGRVAEVDGHISGVLRFPAELEAYAGLKHYDEVVVTLEG